MRGLYAIVDVPSVEARGLSVLDFARAVLAAKPGALQIRDKRARARAIFDLLCALVPECRASGVALFANDRPDLAALAGVGVHLGQADLPAAEARRVMAAIDRPDRPTPSGLLGLSVHDDEELTRSLAERPDYLAFGPVFGTQSKADPEPTIGLDGLARLTSRARRETQVPFVAIGGIDRDRAAEVAAVVPCVAVISALLPPEGASEPLREVEARARALVEALAPWS